MIRSVLLSWLGNSGRSDRLRALTGTSRALLQHMYSTKASRPVFDEEGRVQLIEITESAVNKLAELAEKKGQNSVLRVSVEAGGCHGFQYKFELDRLSNVSKTDDILFSRDSVSVVIDETSLKLLSGAQIDYSRELIGSAFQVIQNPRAETGCGCGVSFNIGKYSPPSGNKS